jgi:RNA polymerase sigma factor for flagellar operon FliA
MMRERMPMTGATGTATAVDTLWRRYRRSGDPDARAKLLERYIGLVHHVARQVASRVSDVVEIGDLVSAGTLGLVQALDSFDLSRGLAFSTYAVRRIRGAMLDELRARDWVPRSVRARGRRMATAVAALEGRLGRAPEPGEVARVLSLDLETYWRWSEEVGGAIAAPLGEVLADGRTALPGAGLADEETHSHLRAAIAALPAREATVLALYYYEELNLRQIAQVLRVTESRVSQIRTLALKHLRQRLGGQATA